MTWSVQASKSDESSKVRWELVPYMLGRAYDFGCTNYRVFPHFVGVDDRGWPASRAGVSIKKYDKMEEFASNHANCIFSSFILDKIEYEEVPAVLREWVRIVKQGGYLILYLPDSNEYPKVGEAGCSKDHKWDVSYEKVLLAMSKVGRGFDLIDYQVRSEDDEYGLLFVFQIGCKGQNATCLNAIKPGKTCAIVRLGAIGDIVQTSSILPWLKEQGYHITMYLQDNAGYQIIKHDPHVDRFIVQGRDDVPPEFLQEFWDYTKKKYDRWINLCESIEGTLLAVTGRANFEWPNEVRKIHMDRNYLEWIHAIAEVPPPYKPKVYFTIDEKAWARKKASNWGSKNILWSLAGSSGHKVWPHLDAIIASVMLAYKDVHVVLVGDEACKVLELGWEKEPRVHLMSGEWSIRETLAFAEIADLVIGTETGVLNAVGMSDVPKIITLSHSSQEMLTKHWKNTIVLEQPEGVGCPKHPCRQLHHNWDHCPKHEETGTALCQFHIGADVMWNAVQSVLGRQERMVA